MKKKNNKFIFLAIIAILFVAMFIIFILNYSKDDSSFSILEKKWLNDNANNVLDVSVYNDIPVYGKKGAGVIFDMLEDFTSKYDVDFNKVAYTQNSISTFKDIAFKVVDENSEDDILLYEDYYVLISKKNSSIDKISDIKDITICVMKDDLSNASNYLSEAVNVSYLSKESINDILIAFNNNESEYALLPYNMYIDFILENDLNIVYHLNDMSKKYVLSIENKTLNNIMHKYYNSYRTNELIDSYREEFLNEFFIDKEISEAERMGYNEKPYTVGYITYMPYTDEENEEFVGTLSNYLSKFEDIYDVDFNLVHYDNIDKMKEDFSDGNLDLVFSNFSLNNLNIDVIKTSSLFKEEYSVLSKEKTLINSIKSLKGKEVNTLKNTYINDMLASNNVKTITYDNTDELLRYLKSDSLVVIDKATYDYYKTKKFDEYYELYVGILPNEYSFAIRDVNKNTIFAKMFSFFVTTVDYNSIKYDYNVNHKIYNFKLIATFLSVVAVILFVIILVFIINKKKNKVAILKNNDKLKYVDIMTSLKNRNYLNSMIKKWDDNVIYPQSFVVVDLNNIKNINDTHGHEEGDVVIKKAASTLIVNQIANTDIIRTDGTEFLIYMVGYSEKDVVNYVRKIYKDLKELPYGYGATIGYSMIMDDVKTIDDAINEATIDMRKKKEASNDRGD